MTQRPTIAYIEQRLPNLTATFIYREIYALRDKGFPVVTYSVHKPKPSELSAEAKLLRDSTTYIYGASKLEIVKAQAYFLGKRPILYLKLLTKFLTDRNLSKDERRRALLHLIGGAYLARQAAQQGVDHIHAHFTINAATIGMVIAKLLGITFSMTAHNSCFTEQTLLREKLTEAKFVASISHYTTKFLTDFMPDVPSLGEKIHIVRCGIDLQRFKPVQIVGGNKRPIILSIAQLAERKGMTVLVEACRILRDRGVEFTCIIGGDGPQKELLEAYIAEHNLADTVSLIGRIYQEDILRHLRDADIFAMACITAENGDVDGIPVALMEAMSMTIPPVSTTVSGIPDLIDHNVNGLLTAEKDADAFADALQTLIEDEALREQYGQAARQKIINEFNLDKTSNKIANLFESELTQTVAQLAVGGD